MSLQQGIQHKQKTQSILDKTAQISYRFQGETVNPNKKNSAFFSNIPFLSSKTKDNVEGFENFNYTLYNDVTADKYIPAINRVDKSHIYSNNISHIDPGYDMSSNNDNIQNNLTAIQNRLTELRNIGSITATNLPIAQQQVDEIRDNQIELKQKNVELQDKITEVRNSKNISSLKNMMGEYINTREKYNELTQTANGSEVAIYEQLNLYNYNYAILGVSLLGSVILLKYLFTTLK